MSFDSTKTSLKKLLDDVHSGKLQLPEFQRDYVWNEDDVRSLLASVGSGFPVGALLSLEVGGDIRFKPRGINGTSVDEVEPEVLLLDGQQRMTSLYQAVLSESPAKVRTAKGKAVKRYFYVDIEAAMSGTDLEAAIVMVPEDRIEKGAFGKTGELDLSSAEREYATLHFPLNQTMDPLPWIMGAMQFWKDAGEDKSQLIFQFQQSLLTRISSYEMPIIKLLRDNSREAVCTVFEKVNVGGKKLDAFELVTAIYAADDFDLRADWLGEKDSDEPGRLERLKGPQPKKGIFKDLASTDFLQACTVLHTMDQREAALSEGKSGKDIPAVSCRREIMLGLPLEAYKQYRDKVEEGFREAAKFLNGQKIIWGRDVPYPPQLVALAAFFARRGTKLSQPEVDKIAKWYWRGVLGEYYGSATETKIARDVPQLIEWLGGGPEPRTVWDTTFDIDRLDSLRMRLSAAYKGLHALLMRSGCQDFVSGKTVDLMTAWDDAIDIHHIFPRDWCKKQGIERERYDSIINKTALSAATNREIGGRAPSDYLNRIEDRYGVSAEALDAILKSHLVDPDLLRADAFDAFYAARKLALADLVEEAGVKVNRASQDDEPALPDPDLEELEVQENMLDDADEQDQ
ncbi:DUF262 domain-containing protein [Sphingomicrobium lutaoense]|uniref:GmrSD restriction endonucleases N-terminal domain-containing protein n=1 Tax=Sphingomicrobium lutaoense TaxID=515949 RepID=A0A839Z494_9SPHN|nr:DUF262 domain-containing protein [Sphingomicrobium lutaoense]MBB3763444.1 hypothetical protein [Sphingomicrobium lutaoense]